MRLCVFSLPVYRMMILGEYGISQLIIMSEYDLWLTKTYGTYLYGRLIPAYDVFLFNVATVSVSPYVRDKGTEWRWLR